MYLYEEILIEKWKRDEIYNTSVAAIVKDECYLALQNMKAIIEDDSLSDAECFQKIEAIICILEDLGSSGGTRHDFG